MVAGAAHLDKRHSAAGDGATILGSSPPEENAMADDARWTARSEHERGLLDVVRRYEHYYNTDVEKLVLRCMPPASTST